jgi:glutamate synthase domain-containing protein 1
MATESEVTPGGSHPFAPGRDVALVHNGTFSNYHTVRRGLEHAGHHFDSDNDSEVCARLVSSLVDGGATLSESLEVVLDRMDGFFTLLVSTADEFAVVRDPIGCKPAVIAECGEYVAMASEYQALAALPGIEAARVFEPEAGRVHAWSR